MFNKIMKSVKKGFTLVELLVVIAVLGVLAAGLIVGINPADKIRVANDSTVQTHVSQIASAATAYSTQHNGAFTATLDELRTLGELTSTPVAPVGTNAAGTVAYVLTTAGYAVAPGGCTTAGNTCTEARIWNRQTSISHAATTYWMWCSRTGRVGLTTGPTDADCLP